MQIAESSGAVAGTSEHQSQRRNAQDVVHHLTGGNLRLIRQGKAYTNTFLTPEQMKEDLEMFTALLEFTL